MSHKPEQIGMDYAVSHDPRQLVGMDVICKELSRNDVDTIFGDVDALEKLYNETFPDSPIRYVGDDCFERVGKEERAKDIFRDWYKKNHVNMPVVINEVPVCHYDIAKWAFLAAIELMQEKEQLSS